MASYLIPATIDYYYQAFFFNSYFPTGRKGGKTGIDENHPRSQYKYSNKFWFKNIGINVAY